MSLLQEESLDMGDEALLHVLVAVNLYETHSYGISLVLYNLRCKHQGFRVLSDAFRCDLSFGLR